MHSEWLDRSPLLIWPLTAMFVFLATWVGAAIRVMTRSKEDLAAAARLPLESEAHDGSP